MRTKRIFYLISVLLIVLSSCTSNKRLTYLRESSNNEEFKTSANNFIYKIQPKDILYIQINSLNKEVSELFNVNGFSNVASYNDQFLYLHSFSVNDSGFVSLPILGQIKVIDLTIDEAHIEIQNKINEYLKDATVIVKLISYRISILGEVKAPGHYILYQNNINIFEALSKAGDITDYGNKKNVLLLRPYNNTYKSIRLDLTDKNVLSSEYISLLPNDIIYVEPAKLKAFRLNSPNISIILSSISTLILVLSFVITK